MSKHLSAALPTRTEFEKALSIANEGRERHGLYAVEDAEAILKPIAQFHWRQTTLGLIPVMTAMSVWIAFELPWYTPLIGVAVSVLITRAIAVTPATAALFAPPGYTADDVARAASTLLGIGSR